MKKLLVNGIILTGALIGWSCGPSEQPKAIETPPSDAARTAEVLKAPVLPHTITDVEIGRKTVCVVMNTGFTVNKNTPAAEYKGNVYYFCCGKCPEEFKANPEKYAK